MRLPALAVLSCVVALAGCSNDLAEASASADLASSDGTSTAPPTHHAHARFVAYDGGSSDTPAPSCGDASASDVATVSSFIDTLPYAPPADAQRAAIAAAIVKTCAAFSPPGFGARNCWAHLAAAIHKESAYDTRAAVTDAYAMRAIGSSKAKDPTVGLLQIRFSSTVHDFAAHGPLDVLACTGCALPDSLAAHLEESGDSQFWAVSGPTENMSTMTTPACNVALGAWYYYVNATGNGNASAATYIDGYCAGGGTAANLVTGLRSHLNGPWGGRGVVTDLASLASIDPGGYGYVTAIKGWFDVMIEPSAGKHPFFALLPPSPAHYCR